MMHATLFMILPSLLPHFTARQIRPNRATRRQLFCFSHTLPYDKASTILRRLEFRGTDATAGLVANRQSIAFHL
jgi:hypothetical protein